MYYDFNMCIHILTSFFRFSQLHDSSGLFENKRVKNVKNVMRQRKREEEDERDSLDLYKLVEDNHPVTRPMMEQFTSL